MSYKASRTGDRSCVHRAPEGNVNQQIDDSPPTQRKQQDQHQERCTTGRYHIAQAVHDSTRKHIRTTDSENQRHKGNLRFADDILTSAKTPHELQQML